MAHFAKLGVGDIVTEVHVVRNEVITDNNGNEQELNSCGLGDQEFSVTQAVFDACLANQKK